MSTATSLAATTFPGGLADGELVQSAIAGREACFEELMRRYQRPIAAYVYRMVGDYDSALDLTQFAHPVSFGIQVFDLDLQNRA